MASQVGTAQVRPGELTQGALRVGSLADGSPLNVPVLVASGKAAGPTLWIGGCVHGDEYGGAASLIRYMRGLDVSALQGTLIGVPVTNPPAFTARWRFSSIDGANLNRIFPGDPLGSYSPQLATVLADTIAETADYLVDLHSGGLGAEVPFYAIYPDDGSEPARRAKWLAKRLGCDTLWRTTGEAGLGGSIVAEALRRGIPGVTVECGGGTVTPRHVADYTIAIDGAVKALGLLPGEPPVQSRYTIVGSGAFLFNREGGLFVQECPLGAFLPKDGLIARMINLYGDTVEEIRCPADNAYIAALRIPYWPTHAGEIVGEAVPLEGHETVDE